MSTDETQKPTRVSEHAQGRAVEVVSHDVVFQGYFRVERYLLRHSLHRGGMSNVIHREVFERGHAVAVLPYDPVRDEVVMIEQFRVGGLAAGWEPWEYETVAGILDKDGESPAEVAIREAREEADLEIATLIPIHKYLVSPGGTSETVEIFCGLVDATGAGGVHGLDSEDEDIRVVPIKAEEAFRMMDAGEMPNAMSLIALQWLKIHRDAIRAEHG